RRRWGREMRRRYVDPDLENLRGRRANDLNRPTAVGTGAMPGEELGNDLRGLHGRREADALGGGGEEGVEAFEGEGQVRAAFGTGQGMDLIDDHRIHPGEPCPRARGEHEKQRLRG